MKTPSHSASQRTSIANGSKGSPPPVKSLSPDLQLGSNPAARICRTALQRRSLAGPTRGAQIGQRLLLLADIKLSVRRRIQVVDYDFVVMLKMFFDSGNCPESNDLQKQYDPHPARPVAHD